MVIADWAVRNKQFNCGAVLKVIKTYRYKVYIEIFVTVNCGAGPKTSYHSKPNLGRAITTQNFPLTPSFTIFSFFFFLLEEKKSRYKELKERDMTIWLCSLSSNNDINSSHIKNQRSPTSLRFYCFHR